MMELRNSDSDSLKNIEYKEVLQEEIQNFLDAENTNDGETQKEKKQLYKFKITLLEIVNRILFFVFIVSFLCSFVSVFSASKIWFVFYVIAAFSCIFYTPNRKALKELIAAWPNIEDLIRGRSLWK